MWGVTKSKANKKEAHLHILPLKQPTALRLDLLLAPSVGKARGDASLWLSARVELACGDSFPVITITLYFLFTVLQYLFALLSFSLDVLLRWLLKLAIFVQCSRYSYLLR